jgi:hypothetical protein
MTASNDRNKVCKNDRKKAEFCTNLGDRNLFFFYAPPTTTSKDSNDTTTSYNMSSLSRQPAGAAEAAPGDTNYEPTTSDMYLHMEMLEQKREEAREQKREEARERKREEARERKREEAREQKREEAREQMREEAREQQFFASMAHVPKRQRDITPACTTST